ncbi:unnamed protein product [Bursaphelenchus okinawaensis]|uniref:Tc1-like transposase DDE domain-containing protein n=1 Tax=Bursaphelenchus okinawaensis TaxID=465554 RepID=A0A811KB34_9BILA|nr:unnamed protein product [Bursaphelenchus okinawaensis]CAG9095174.1 unnamed protein product [Bursaphelenchus okinawaensis]
MTVHRAVKRFEELRHDCDRPRSGRPASVKTVASRQMIMKRFKRNPRTPVRKMAREAGIKEPTLRRIVEKKIKMKPYKLKKVQKLTEENKAVRFKRRKISLIFVDEGVKINKEVYQRDILEAVVLPWSREHFKNTKWTFQQDSAPAHKAKPTQEWCRAHFPDYITSAEWPPYSPDLNPMDYSIWSILEARVCCRRHQTLESLKQALIEEWDKLSPQDLRSIAENFVKRLRLCVAAKGGHFETA